MYFSKNFVTISFIATGNKTHIFIIVEAIATGISSRSLTPRALSYQCFRISSFDFIYMLIYDVQDLFHTQPSLGPIGSRIGQLICIKTWIAIRCDGRYRTYI